MEIGKSHEAVLRLYQTHPKIVRKLAILYRLSPTGVFSDNLVKLAGLTDKELTILKDYGIIKRVEP